jgi:hypothetical protein
MALDLEVNEVEVKVLTSLASVTWSTGLYCCLLVLRAPIAYKIAPPPTAGSSSIDEVNLNDRWSMPGTLFYP